MEMIADILLVAGAIGAAAYCYVLARRLARFTDLDSGVGAAVAILSQQVDELGRVLKSARAQAEEGTESLRELTMQADSVAHRLELLVASMHDLPEIEAPIRPEPVQKPAARSEPDATFVRHSRRSA